MLKTYFILIFTLCSIFSFSQEGFQFKNKKKIKIPFQLIDNLIVIPVILNSVKLNFILDSGVEKTILFSIDETDSLKFNNIDKIKIRGLGNGEPIDALHAKDNKLVIEEFIDLKHEIYIILDQEINFSTQLGIPIHGIIGYDFFKNHFVEINYQNKKINVYRNLALFSPKKLKKFEEIPISLELNKPYIAAFVNVNNAVVKTKLLVDSGGSDTIWLFENKENIKCNPLFFKDYLGRGFSGDILGKRSRIAELQIGKFKITNPTASFPDTLSLKSVNMVQGRNGSVGGGLLKRFTTIYDYKNNKMYLKKNSNFSDPYNYDMSGLEIQHSGVQWISEKTELKTTFVNSEVPVYNDYPQNVKYNFVLKPVYEITNIREKSPAAIAGVLKGDKIIKINNIQAYKLKLQEIKDMLQFEEDKTIILEIERKNKNLNFKFQLKKIL